MPISNTVTQITVTGTYVDYAGVAVAGQIKFTSSVMLRNSLANQMVVPSTISVTLDSNGAFSVSLPSTNDTDLIPTFSYEVEEAFPNGRTYTITLPANTIGSLDLADISPVPSLSETYVGLVLQVPFDTLTADIDALDLRVNQSNNTIPQTKYWAISGSYDTYTEVNNAFATYTLLNAGPYPVSGSDVVEYVTQADNAATTASSSKTTADALVVNKLNSLLLIGG